MKRGMYGKMLMNIQLANVLHVGLNRFDSFASLVITILLLIIVIMVVRQLTH